MDSLRATFLNPPLSFRGAPFWSWNDQLQVEELVRQVKDMKAHGMGGFFMHSRDGLETVYMSPEWMKCIEETVKAASETGMGAWLYDEDRWPSGFAGGLVPAQGGDAFRAKAVTLETSAETPADSEDVLAIFAAQLDGEQIRSARRLENGQAPLEAGEVYLVFRRKVSEGSEWFNDDAYSDNLNPDSVAAFLNITYETYKKSVGDEFGKAIPGIFTDESNIFNLRMKMEQRALPWTDGLPEFFRQRRGYDLLDVLPWLFYEGEPSAKARHDYWYTISQRFAEAYSKQLGEWCEKNGLAFTGHFLNENEMGYAILRGGAIMPHYRFQQVPGIDMLTEQNHEFMTIKQCSSVANQFNRQRVLSETYGCSGWEFTFEGQKWNGDWQYVLGVNLRCQHLALYSLRGCRKRDFPPAFNYNTTWWKYNGVVEDYFARVGAMLSEGKAVRDVLLLHPVATGWSMLGEGKESQSKVNAYGERVNDFAQALLATHYDFDFGDEQILASDGNVRGREIVVGQAAYPVVVIPPETRTLLASTVDMLARFTAGGGKVIAFAPLPEWIEAQPAERLAKLWQHPGVEVLTDVSQLNERLEMLLPRRISLRTPQGQQAARLLYMQREVDGRQVYFIVNNDRNNAYEVEVALEGGQNGLGRVEAWDPLTGKADAVAAENQNGKLCFPTRFAPAESRLYMVDPQGQPAAPETAGLFDPRADRHDALATYIGPSAAFTRTDPNVLTLDMCQYRLEGGEWSPVMEVWRAQNEVREALGMRPNYYNGLPQRYRWALKKHPKDGTPVELLFHFEARETPETPVWLLVESAEQFEVKLNDENVENTPEGWYLDRAFDQVRLPKLQKGQNALRLRCAYTNYMELEDCFLLGDFGVSLDRAIIAEPERLHFGDWTGQGYPHYAGSMIYHGKLNYEPGQAVRVELGETRAVDVAVHVNGQLAGHIPWVAANGLDITPCLKAGENQVDIEVVASPRNMLGPLHRAPEHEAWTDWRSFRRTDHTFTPDYVLWPWGLFGQVQLI